MSPPRKLPTDVPYFPPEPKKIAAARLWKTAITLVQIAMWGLILGFTGISWVISHRVTTHLPHLMAAASMFAVLSGFAISANLHGHARTATNVLQHWDRLVETQIANHDCAPILRQHLDDPLLTKVDAPNEVLDELAARVAARVELSRF